MLWCIFFTWYSEYYLILSVSIFYLAIIFCYAKISHFTTPVNHVRIEEKLEAIEGKEKYMSAEIRSDIYSDRKDKNTMDSERVNKVLDAWKTHLSEIRNCPENLSAEVLWQVLCELEQTYFCMVKGIPFTYIINGHEMFVNRKEKSITQATVVLSAQTCAGEAGTGSGDQRTKEDRHVRASYLYPIFDRLA